MTDTVADTFTPVDVAVVDIDLLWEVEVANALNAASVYATHLAAVAVAIDRVRPDRGAVIVIGPTTLADPETDPLADPAHLARVVAGTRGIAVLLAGAGPVAPVRPPDGEAAARWRQIEADAPVDEVVIAIRELLAIARADAKAAVGSAVEAAVETGPGAGRDLHASAVVLVTAAKGGEGTTTIAVNLAAALAGLDESTKVALVEADPNFGDIAITLGIDAPEIVADPAALLIPASRVIAHVTTHEPSGVQVVLPPRAVDRFAVLPEATLRSFFTYLEPIVDIVVVDAPYHVVMQTGLADYADVVLLVTRPTIASAKNAAIAVGSLARRDNLGVVLNGVSRPGILRRTNGPGVEQVEVALRRDVIGSVPDAPELNERDDTGRLAVIADPESDAAAAIVKLAAVVRKLISA